MRSNTLTSVNYNRCRRPHHRRGKVLALLVISLPALCGIIGLVVDGGLLFSASRQLQHVADSAATAAAMEIHQGRPYSEAVAVAEKFIQEHNGFADATVTLHVPPTSGPYAGSSSHVEVLVEDEWPTYVIHVLSGTALRRLSVRAVAGVEPSTSGAAIVVLDPGPPPFEIAPLPATGLLPALPAVVGGLEVLGLGRVEVEGAILVNTQWGGVDENGEPVGEPAGLLRLTHAVSATPLLNTSRLATRDLRVVGGVDDDDNYEPLIAGEPHPLKAGRIAVPDPLQNLPAPTLAVDPVNVKETLFGGKAVLGIPLISPPVTLQPGVYDWIEVVSGRASFQPGVYIIRGKNPLTQLSLNILAGQVEANGVMFYITDTSNYSPSGGLPDANDSQNPAAVPSLDNTMPSAVINLGLLGSTYRGLAAPGSPFDGMLIYQRRLDRRPIVLIQENLLGPGQIRGTVYSKWGHVVLAGKGPYDTRFVVGSLRLIALLDMQIRPSELLPPAEDVYLVE